MSFDIKKLPNPLKQSLWIIFLQIGLAAAQTPDSTMDLSHLITTALQNNPQLLAMENQVQAVETTISQSGALPDPQLTLGMVNIPTSSYRLDQDPMTQKVIGLSQHLPFFGKLTFRETMAEKEYAAINLDYEYSKLRLINNLSRYYYQLYFIQRNLDIYSRNRILYDDYVSIASTKYSVGKGIQQDVLKSQVELLKIDARLIDLKEQESNLKAQINVLLNRMPQAPLGKTVSLKMPMQIFNLDSLQQLAISANPLLQRQNSLVEKNKAAHKLARRDYWPDFILSLNYAKREDRPDFLSGMVSVNIPLFAASKQSKRVQQTALLLQSADFALESQKNTILLQVKNLYDALIKNQDLIQLYDKNIIPQARQALKSAISSYQNDKVDFLTVINNQITLLKYELSYEKVITDYYTALTDLEMICGGKTGVKKKD
jgi:outer membrane protein TolC